MKIEIDFGNISGKIKPLHGVNNGPVGFGSLVDVSPYYKEAQFPYARLHDPNWPHPREVDIYTIFPNFEADPTDAANYDFRRTDDYLRSILNTGTKIVYRLGVSIEHTAKKYFTHPPQDFDKWAQVCLGIIKHYNQGWADGYEWGIEYWEIWNEPDLGEKMWSGTPRQYFELYKAASSAIKEQYPSMKVGGYGACDINNLFTKEFLRYCKENNLPLDFFSWHIYTDCLEDIEVFSSRVNGWLNEYGFTDTESHLNEWNYRKFPDWNTIYTHEDEATRVECFGAMKNEEGASFTAAALLLMQDCDIDLANYYNGQPMTMFCGLFDYYGAPQKTYYAFKAFSELAKCPLRVAVSVSEQHEGVYCCASLKPDMSEGVVLLSGFRSNNWSCDINLLNMPSNEQGKSTIDSYLIDTVHTLEKVDSVNISSSQHTLSRSLQNKSVLLIKVTRG